MPGTGASISTKPRHAVRVLGGEGVADHVADVVRDDVGLLDVKRVQHGGDIAGLGLLVVAAGGMRREAHAAKVGHDDL